MSVCLSTMPCFRFGLPRRITGIEGRAGEESVKPHLVFVHGFVPEAAFGGPRLVAQLVTEGLYGNRVFGLGGYPVEENEKIAALDTVHVIEGLLVGEDGAVPSDELVCKTLCVSQMLPPITE